MAALSALLLLGCAAWRFGVYAARYDLVTCGWPHASLEVLIPAGDVLRRFVDGVDQRPDHVVLHGDRRVAKVPGRRLACIRPLVKAPGTKLACNTP